MQTKKGKVWRSAGRKMRCQGNSNCRFGRGKERATGVPGALVMDTEAQEAKGKDRESNTTPCPFTHQDSSQPCSQWGRMIQSPTASPEPITCVLPDPTAQLPRAQCSGSKGQKLPLSMAQQLSKCHQ